MALTTGMNSVGNIKKRHRPDLYDVPFLRPLIYRKVPQRSRYLVNLVHYWHVVSILKLWNDPLTHLQRDGDLILRIEARSRLLYNSPWHLHLLSVCSAADSYSLLYGLLGHPVFNARLYGLHRLAMHGSHSVAMRLSSVSGLQCALVSTAELFISMNSRYRLLLGTNLLLTSLNPLTEPSIYL